MTKLFVYGTLINPTLQKSLLDRHPYVYKDRWIFGFKRGRHHSYPAIYPCKGLKVGGVVLLLLEEEMKIMDEYESNLYKLEKVNIANNKGQILCEALVYRPVDGNMNFLNEATKI